MTTKKSFERGSDRRYPETEGLRRKRLKDENRWKFNPNQSYISGSDDDEEEDYDDENEVT